ncbi:hypothetical protein Cch01nite_07760 [Cellulomonas chitinilytica]|uniref:Putative T7SS secretion signal domain-containing protein n=1 Tax=Cellulomonas chitinilytica TaxID=398759 RepID=A0A919NYU3_9CELL|nr:hypothetical protein [Cellulomonas chitinilytica]GIG20052.1 hypothetical protein Cch01nite_07760 [Cellulomonas chitinilytica]
MAADLGTTTDPLDLVPGRAASVHTEADTLRRRAAQLEDAADALAAIRVPGWQGDAADHFSDKLAARPKGWRITADALTQASTALGTYADVLTSAQTNAAHAIALWQRAEHLSAAAAYAHSIAVDTYTHTVSRGLPATRPVAAPDPGEHLRREAREVLKDARDAVRRAGDDATDTLRHLVVSDVPIVRTETHRDGRNVTGDVSGSVIKIDPSTGAASLGLAKAEGQAILGGWGASASSTYGSLNANASAGFKIGAQGSAEAGLSSGQLHASASGRAGLMGEASAGVSADHASANVKATGLAGAYAEAGVGIGKQGVEARAGGFAGAQVAGEFDVEAGGVGGQVGAEGWAGIGAEAGAVVGPDEHGIWRATGHAGAAVGIGGSLSSGISVDPKEVLESILDAVEFLNEAYH